MKGNSHIDMNSSEQFSRQLRVIFLIMETCLVVLGSVFGYYSGTSPYGHLVNTVNGHLCIANIECSN